jgi:glycosyltransferase involved in cell wall biosynthesis
MNIYLTPPQPSRGLQRIADALTRYAPTGSEIVTNLYDAELVILYAIGRQDSITEKAHSIKQRGQRYAVMQACLRSTMKPHTSGWRYLWDNAECVWSYYDLQAAIMVDGGTGTAGNFYHAPLGADAEVFYPAHSNLRATKFVIVSSGLSRLSESVRECWEAAKIFDRQVLHLGPLKPPVYVTTVNGVKDDALAVLYSNCEFVSALRRTEGFELPGIEGLLCGARPICFDTPDYRWNYGDHAEYIHEGTRAEVVEQLIALFKHGARGVTEEERADAVERFNWETIIGGFYDHIR